MKTNKEINKYFTEEVFGKCWHSICGSSDLTIHNNKIKCIKCEKLVPITSGTNFFPNNPDYFSKDGFWDVWEWAIKKDWWDDFLYYYYGEDGRIFTEYKGWFNVEIVDYKTFAREVFNFLEDKK